MNAAVCPKCGSVRDGGDECLRCGIVFRKFRPAPPADRETRAAPATVGEKLRRSWKVLRWAPLALSVSVLGLLLLEPSPPIVHTSEEATGQALMKVEEFERSVRAGSPATLTMDEPELNGWIRSNLAIKRQPSPTQIAKAYVSGQRVPRAQETPSNVREVRLKLQGDRLLAWVSYDAYGLDVTLELEGTLSGQDGYLRLTPTSGRLGSLPLTRAVLDAAAQKLFDAPENREKFRLPPAIADIRVSDGQLAVISR